MPIFRRARIFGEDINSAASIIRGRVCAFSSGNNESVALHPRLATNIIHSSVRGNLMGNTLPLGIYCVNKYCHCRGPRTKHLHRFRRFNIRYFNTTTPGTSTRIVVLTGRILSDINVRGVSLRVGSVNYPRYEGGCDTTLGGCFDSGVSALYSAYGSELSHGPVHVLSYGSPVYDKLSGGTPIIVSCLYSSYHRRFSNIGGRLSTTNVGCGIGPRVMHKLSCCAHAIFRFISNSVNTRDAIYNNNECSKLISRVNNPRVTNLNFNVNVRHLVLMLSTRGARLPGISHYSLCVTAVNGGTTLGTARLYYGLEGSNFGVRASIMNHNLGTRVGCTSGVNTTFAVILNSDRLRGGRTGLGGVRDNRRVAISLGGLDDRLFTTLGGTSLSTLARTLR